MLVAVIGGCEGSAVLAVVELNAKVMDGGAQYQGDGWWSSI